MAWTGLQTYRVLWPNNTTGVLIRAGGAQVKGWSLHATVASIRYVKLYDKATAPTVGTDTPTHTIMIPASGSTVLNLGDTGLRFDLGLGIGVSTGVTDADTTAPAANDVVVNLFYF